eukprot:1182005-Prorocentrum_minimum.AAC.1
MPAHVGILHMFILLPHAAVTIYILLPHAACALLYASKRTPIPQGLSVIQAASAEYGWGVRLSDLTPF